MSTRCNIILKSGDMQVYLYHHCDGYPSGVGAYLQKLIGHKWEIYDWVNYLLKNTEDKGYEFTNMLHGDIEYCYVIDVEADTLKCYSVYYGCDEQGNVDFNKQVFEGIKLEEYMK